jgi:hypothetical protein
MDHVCGNCIFVKDLTGLKIENILGVIKSLSFKDVDRIDHPFKGDNSIPWHNQIVYVIDQCHILWLFCKPVMLL